MKLLRFVIFFLFLICASIGRATITAETNRTGPYTATVLPATVSVVFPFQQASDLLVLDLGQGGTTNDPPITLTLNSDYTVTGGGYNSTTQMQSGNVVLVTGGANNVQVNDQIMILRSVPINQTSSLVSGVLTAAAIEKALDKQATISQRLRESEGRALRFEPGETLDGKLLRSARAGKTLGFDANGNILYGPGGGGTSPTYTAGAGLLLASNVFSVNPTQSLTSLTVTNPITGSLSGNALTATALQTARAINGVNFDGTANVTVTAAAGTLTGAALPASVTSAPGLLSAAVGTFGSMAIQNAGTVAITGGSINGAVVTGLVAPSATTDAANKAYVDAIAAGAQPRTSVIAATTANITLSGPQTIDGQSIIAGNRVLVKNQTLPAQNGIYDCAAGAWTRSLDSDTAAELKVGFYYFVSSGTTQVSTSWFIATAPVVVNTDPVVFSQYSSSQNYTAGVGLTLAANQFSVNASQTQITAIGTLASLTVSGTVGATTLNVSGLGTISSGLNVTGATALGGTITATGTASFQNDVILSRGAGTNYLYYNSDFQLAKNGTGPALTIDANRNIAISAGELKTRYSIFTTSIAAYDSTTGGLYAGFGSGTSILRSVNDNSGAAAPLSIQIGNGTEIISVTTVGETLRGVLTLDTNPHILTTKQGLHVIINVKDYGAVGDGVTNDTAAVNSAIAALTNYSTLYFPSGKFLVTPGSITAFTSLSYVTIMGDGRTSVIYSSTTGAPSGFFVVAGSCDYMTLRDFALVGSATVRGSGGHGLIVYSPHTLVSGIYITGTSDFGMYIGSGGSLFNKEVQVVNCISDRTLGDGFHFGPVTDSGIYNCISYYTGDDGVGIGDDGAIGFPATRIEVVGFQSIQAGNHAGGGTHGAGIRIFDGAVDIHVTGGSIYQSCEAGLTVGRFSSTTAYNTRIKVDGLKVYQCLQNAGMYGQINFQFVNQLSVSGCWSEAPLSQGCYAFLDCNNVSVTGNTAKDAVLRAFLTDDSSTTNVAATWSNWTFSSNVCLGTPSNESYYFVPAATKTITNLMLIGNSETGQSFANYISTNRLAGTCKIVTNVSLGGKAITNGGSGTVPTSTPNY